MVLVGGGTEEAMKTSQEGNGRPMFSFLSVGRMMREVQPTVASVGLSCHTNDQEKVIEDQSVNRIIDCAPDV